MQRLEPKIVAALADEARSSSPWKKSSIIRLDIYIDNMLAERKLLRAFWILSTFDPVMRRRGRAGQPSSPECLHRCGAARSQRRDRAPGPRRGDGHGLCHVHIGDADQDAVLRA